MATSTAQKLRIKEGFAIKTINAPTDFISSLGPLPGEVSISEKQSKPNQVHWFVTNRAEMEKQLPSILNQLKPGIVCWIYYPKGSSGIQTDLTRDKGWEKLLQQDLQWLSLISFDETWSAFGMRLKEEKDLKKDEKVKERPVFDYVDPKTKSVRLPEDFNKALKPKKDLVSFFDSLSFTNKKEYIEWIVTAKRPETRERRVVESIEKLSKGWKNPAGR